MGAKPAFAAFIAATLGVAACAGAMAAEPSRIESLIAKLKSADEVVRTEAGKALDDLEKSGVTQQEGLRLLDAALDDYPANTVWTGSERLVSVLLSQPRPAYVPAILKNFPRYKDRKAQAYALAILTETRGEEAIRAFMELYRAHALDEGLELLPRAKTALAEHTSASILFPGLLELAVTPKLKDVIYRILFYHLERGSVAPSNLTNWSGAFLEHLEAHLSKLRPKQAASGIGWMWEDAYQEHREPAGVMIDLVGYLDAPEVRRVMRDCLTLGDTKLKYFAAMHLLRVAEAVDADEIASIAADGEVRGFMHDKLASMGKLDLMPAKYRTQESLAEANMVHWLVYPTELARVPDEIELMATVAGKTNKDEVIYLFRFRTHPPHWAAENGWIAGIAGSFPRRGPPSTTGGGSTFSSFQKWDSATPEEHIRAIVDLLDKARELR